MKRFLVTILTVFLSSALQGCGSSEHAPSIAGAQSSASGSSPSHASLPQSWALAYLARCESGALENCQAAYGFSVYSDGHFQLGPGPKGQLLTGQVSGEELRTIVEALSQPAMGSLQNVDVPASACALEPAADTRVLVRWKSGERERVVLTRNGAGECSDMPSESREKADEVSARMQALAAKYSPSQFPNPCIDAAQELSAAYAMASSCQQDSDCAYLDSFFSPAKGQEPLIADDCTYLRPMVVGNRFEAVVNQREFTVKRELARGACGSGLRRGSCEAPVTFVPSGHPPVCRAGRCQPNPELALI